eukprot:scaffold44324_cov30-Tisochrysis_lutea.AAC.5
MAHRLSAKDTTKVGNPAVDVFEWINLQGVVKWLPRFVIIDHLHGYGLAGLDGLVQLTWEGTPRCGIEKERQGRAD